MKKNYVFYIRLVLITLFLSNKSFGQKATNTKELYSIALEKYINEITNEYEKELKVIYLSPKNDKVNFFMKDTIQGVAINYVNNINKFKILVKNKESVIEFLPIEINNDTLILNFSHFYINYSEKGKKRIYTYMYNAKSFARFTFNCETNTFDFDYFYHSVILNEYPNW